MKTIPKISLLILLLAILSVGSVAAYDPIVPYPSVQYPPTEPYGVTITVVVDTPLPENQINGEVYLWKFMKKTGPRKLIGQICRFIVTSHQYDYYMQGMVDVPGYEREYFRFPPLDENQRNVEIHVSLTPIPEPTPGPKQ